MFHFSLFTFGYWGWGNATHQLVEVMDAVEEARGYKPPLFVDIRIQRSVRAPGFTGDAFKELVGDGRYVWFSGLGNLAITEGGPLRLKDPGQARELLLLVKAEAKTQRRIIIFCACEFPRRAGVIACHRVVVAERVIQEARREGIAIEVVEWPGYQRSQKVIEIGLSEIEFKKVKRDMKWIPIDSQLSLAEAGQVAWYSPIKITCEASFSDSIAILAGPPKFREGGWRLPILGSPHDVKSESAVEKQIHNKRKSGGFLIISSR